MPNELHTLAVEYDAAIAAGDRPRAGQILRRIREMLGSLDEGQLLAGAAFLKKLFEMFFPPAQGEVKTLDCVALSDDEVKSLGLIDDIAGTLLPGNVKAQLIAQLVTYLFALIRKARA